MTATFQPSEVPMSTLIQTSLRRGIAKALRQFSQPAILFFLLLLFPAVALAQSGSPFDTGFTALQNLFTGTVAKVANRVQQPSTAHTLAAADGKLFLSAWYLSRICN